MAELGAHDSYNRYGIGHLRPVWEKERTAVSPLLSFPWEQTERAAVSVVENRTAYSELGLDLARAVRRDRLAGIGISDGMVGLNFLARFRVTFEFDRRVLVLRVPG